MLIDCLIHGSFDGANEISFLAECSAVRHTFNLGVFSIQETNADALAA